MVYKTIENMVFEWNYNKILEIVNSTDKIVLKNKPKDRYEIDYTSFGIYKDIVLEFVDIFKANFNEEKVDNMLKNLSTLKIRTELPRRRFFFRRLRSVGYYDSKENEIVIETDETEHIKETMFHELLHMASNNDTISGFSNKKIGRGLNEDYTEYLLKKYFSKKFNIYPRNVIFSLIEKMVGEEKMEELYFKSDIKGLIDSLSKYCDEDKKEAIKIIFEYDTVFYLEFGYDFSKILEEKLKLLRETKEQENENDIKRVR